MITEISVKLWYNIFVSKDYERKILKMSVIKINKGNFDLVKNSEKKVLIDFYADWCGPCRMMSPIIDEIANERSDILVAKVNVDDSPELASAFGVVSIPMLAVVKDGAIINKSVGARPKAQVLSLLEG